MIEQCKEFLAEFDKQYIPVYVKSNALYWDASNTGKTEDWDKYNESCKIVNAFLSNKDQFAKLKSFKESKAITDPIMKRELDILYLYCLYYQVDPKKLDAISNLSSIIERKFNIFRTEYNGKRLTDNEVLTILKHSTDSVELKKVWETQKKIALEIAKEAKDLIKLYNDLAKELGFENYYSMSLELAEQDPKKILELFDELDVLTRDMFKAQKDIIDEALEEKYKVKKEELMPWHYNDLFFQVAPEVYNINLDKYFKGKNLELVTSKFYSGIGLDIESILKRSDLYQREGKTQQAFCLSIDHSDDIRVLTSIVDTSRCMSTMLHEFGHALYEKYVDKRLPFHLRQSPHIFATEAIALLFERICHKSSWLHYAVGVSKAEQPKIDSISNKVFVMTQLVFSRWVQVVFRFEKAMYENPEQDLNKLWWDLVEKYQLLKRPEGRNEPDWAGKSHISTFPCNYHNYLLGELLASQYNSYICKTILGTEEVLSMPYEDNKKVGQYLAEKVFSQGNMVPWWEVIVRATGEPLTSKYYVKELELGLK